MPSGYSTTTAATIALDAALVGVGATVWGVTRGGPRWNGGGTEWREIEFDGKRSRIVGLARKTGFDPQITFEMVEMSTTALIRLEPGASSALVGGVTTITPKKAGLLLVDGDYLTNFWVAWKLGDATWLRILFPKALVTNYEGPSGEDKNEAGISVTVSAALAVVSGDTDAVPWIEAVGLANYNTGL